MTSNMFLNGYVTVRAFGGMAFPVPVQNLLLRNYCAAQGFVYALPLGEHKYENCFMQLFATMNLLKTEGRIGMCSAMMLPFGSHVYNEFRNVFLQKGLEMHCLFENLIIKNEIDLKNAEELISVRLTSDKIDQQSEVIKTFIKESLAMA